MYFLLCIILCYVSFKLTLKLRNCCYLVIFTSFWNKKTLILLLENLFLNLFKFWTIFWFEELIIKFCVSIWLSILWFLLIKQIGPGILSFYFCILHFFWRFINNILFFIYLFFFHQLIKESFIFFLWQLFIYSPILWIK